MDLAYSESIAAFAPAFVKLQAELPTIEKDATSHHGKYADLAGTLEAIKEVMHANGFAVAQPASGGQGGFVSVTTILMHSSGEWMRDTLDMPTGGNGAQGVGSAITYARRYALTAMLSLAAEDDDGNAASQAPPRAQARQTGTRAPARAPKPTEPIRTQTDPNGATDAQVRLLAIQCQKAGIDEANRVLFVGNLVGRPIKSTHELTKDEASRAIDEMVKAAA